MPLDKQKRKDKPWGSYPSQTKQKRREWAQQYYATERGKQYLKKYYEENRLRMKNRNLLKAYGITLKEKNEMMLAQDNKCSICRVRFTDCKSCNTAAHVDHCHTTGKVRSILCCKCNKGLGIFNDSVSEFLSAARYLYKHKH